MSATYKRGEIVWAKIQGYSWWPGRITKIKLKLGITKNRLGKYILKYEKEPYFYVTFFPNDSMSKVKLKSIKKFIEGYQLRNAASKRKKLKRAIYIAKKAFLNENPNLDMDIKRNVFGIKLFSKKKFSLLRKFREITEEEEEQNGENDIQSFIDSEMNECEKYKNELKEKNDKKNIIKFTGKKRSKSKNNENSEINDSENDENSDILDDINKRCNKELKKNANELYKINIEIKRKNTINNIINIFNNIEEIINEYNIDYNFNVIKDLLFILNNYSNHNNETIMNKSISLHKNLLSKFLNNIFNYDSELLSKELAFKTEINNFITKTEELGNEIGLQLDILNNNNNNNNNKDHPFSKNEVFEYNNIINKEKSIKRKIKEINKKNDNNSQSNIKLINDGSSNKNNIEIKNIYDFNFNQDLNDAMTISNNEDNEKGSNKININSDKTLKENNTNISGDDDGKIDNNQPYLKDIINNPNYFNIRPEGKLYPDNFFEEIYLKGGITSKSELLRKKMCLQLYNILKLVQPFCKEEIFKKNVIFLEYLARHIDPLFGNKYMITINMIYNRIKNEAVKIKNKNKSKK